MAANAGKETMAVQMSAETQKLADAIRQDQLASYVRLRGGFPLPLAGAIYWAILGVAGYSLPLGQWAMLAFFGSGLIFPLGLLIARLTGNKFMSDKTATGSVLLPALIGMLLFWAFVVAAAKTAPQLVPLLLAVGMAGHWPVVGWSYGKTFIYSAHAIVRTVAATAIWLLIPDERLTWLPLSVAVVYLLTVVALLIDSKKEAAKT